MLEQKAILYVYTCVTISEHTAVTLISFSKLLYHLDYGVTCADQYGESVILIHIVLSHLVYACLVPI